MKDFFISYATADRDWVKWIAWQLADLGYEVEVDYRDFRPGNYILSEMEKASLTTRQTVAVLSPDYFDAAYTKLEWQYALQRFVREGRPLIPIQVKPVENKGYHETLLHIILVGLTEQAARDLLFEKISVNKDGSRANPLDRTRYPGQSLQTHAPLSSTAVPVQPLTQSATYPPDYKLGQLNRTQQRDHFSRHISGNCNDNTGQTTGYIVSSPCREWPQAIRYKLSYLLTSNRVGEKKIFPELKALIGEKSLVDKSPAQFLWELLAAAINCRPVKSTVQMALTQLDECHIFYRELTTEESKNHAFLAGVLSAWLTIKPNSGVSDHFLLLISETDHIEKAKSGWFSFGRRTSSWRPQMEQCLKESNHTVSLLPELIPPSCEDIDNWLKHHFDEDMIRDTICDAVQKAFPKTSAIPLAELKKVLLPVIQNHQT
ncbi:MAG TPA: hypothetical protein DEO56_01710 [Nitrosomonas nitrosa]|nr:hypothetical protein [Nitrosomonas nitrosa]